MRKLVLCEKPSVARDLARALGVPTQGNGVFAGDSLIITWCIGHLVELEEPSAYVAAWRRWSWDGLPMIPDEFRLRPIKGTSRQWQVVREQLRRRDVSAVINACDAGREGELIFRFCYDLAGCKLPIERLWISSLTTQAIKRGFAELRPGRAYDALAAAARCRAESDWLVGLNATRAVTLWRGGQTLLSLGRVQTPTLAMMVKREREIQRFVPRDYFEVEAQLNADAAGGAAPFVARFEHEGKRRFAGAAPADQVMTRDRSASPPWVESVEEKPVREPPPLLFDLGSLQRTCNRRFGWSAQETLSIAQSLYERHKLLTYPRTDSRYLSHDLVPLLGKTFAALGGCADYSSFCNVLLDGKVGAPRRIFQDHKVTDHHAIIPTPVEHSPERLAALSSSERRLLDMVVRRFLGAFFPDAEFRETKAIIRVDAAASAPAPVPAPDPNKPPDDEYLLAVPPPPDRYLARGRVRVRAGWQEVAGFIEPPGERSQKERAPGTRENEEEDENQDDDKEREKSQTLPPLTVGMRLNPGKNGGFRVVAKQTRPPPRYTEASLLAGMEGAGKQLSDDALRRAMKDHGLGTPATRAAIIETLLDRGYVTRRAKLLVPTELGLELVGTLPMQGLTSPELTGNWEARLAQMADGHGSGSAFMADIAAYVRELIGAVRAAPTPPPLSAPPPSPYSARRAGSSSASSTAASPGARARKPTFRKSTAQKSTARKSTDETRRAKTPRDAASPAAPRRRTAASSDKPAAAPTARRTRAKVASEPKIPKTRKKTVASAAPPPPPSMTATTLPAPGTPVEPPILCPRCRQARLLWGRRAWGCANFRTCPLTIPYEQDGRALSQADLRLVCQQPR